MAQIEQNVVFEASVERVYRALTNATEFSQLTGAEAKISTEEGGEFVCFGTFILGRNVELVANKRIVQAWRVFNWPEGVYSIIRFELADGGDTTELSFTQNGAPEEEVAHLTPGWHTKYWEPMKKYLAG
jgi:activator of HSP90 ATPase